MEPGHARTKNVNGTKQKTESWHQIKTFEINVSKFQCDSDCCVGLIRSESCDLIAVGNLYTNGAYLLKNSKCIQDYLSFFVDQVECV